jgi:predicted nucleotidyltransferase component of viral defense system
LIPRAHVTAWRAAAPWPTDAQVEQDLVLSRALIELFRSDEVARAMAFRGGTALHTLFLARSGRYSEDIDLVQTKAGAIGPALDAIRARLDPWLGEPKRSKSTGSAALLYRFETSTLPAQRMRVKIEINTREHFTHLGLERRGFAVGNPWFDGRADVVTYALEELLGTKLRALYQRRKGRDLYDLWLALTSCEVRDESVVACFERYVSQQRLRISRADFDRNIDEKLQSDEFMEDIGALLPAGTRYDVHAAAALVRERLIARLGRRPAQ